MFALTIVLMALTLAFIYRSEKDVLLDNKKITNLQLQFEPSATLFDELQSDFNQNL